MSLQDLTPVGILALCLYITIKDLVIPLSKKRINNQKDRTLHLQSNPINLDRLYQEFKDFKEAQCKWNEKIEDTVHQLEREKR